MNSGADSIRLMKNAGRWVPEGRSPLLVASVALAAAFAARYALHGLLDSHFRFVFFSAAGVLVCAYGGIWPATFVTLAGLVLSFYFFVEPFNSFELPNSSDIAAMVVYLITTVIALILVEWLQRSKYEVRLYMLESKYQNRKLQELISRMEEAESEAMHHKQKIHVLAASVPEIWHLRTTDGKFEFVNAKLYDLTGMPPGSLEGDHWTKAMHPNDAELAAEIAKRVEATSGEEEVSIRLRTPDGRYESFDAECRCVNEERHGKIIIWSGAVSVMADAAS